MAFVCNTMGKDTTHIEIGTDTRTELRVWKAKRDMTYDDAINALLEDHKQ